MFTRWAIAHFGDLSEKKDEKMKYVAKIKLTELAVMAMFFAVMVLI